MDIGDNVETRRQESRRTPRYREIPRSNPEDGPRRKGEPDKGQETSVRGGGSRGGDTVGFRTPSAPESLSPDQGVVQGCGRLCSAARSGYPRADHGGEGGTVQLRTAPRDKHPNLCVAITGG